MNDTLVRVMYVEEMDACARAASRVSTMKALTARHARLVTAAGTCIDDVIHRAEDA